MKNNIMLAMFSESRDMWKKFDEDFRDMACMKNNIMLEPGIEGGKELPKDEARSLSRQDSKARWEEGWMFPSWTEDQMVYEATIESVDRRKGTARVKFVGFGNSA